MISIIFIHSIIFYSCLIGSCGDFEGVDVSPVESVLEMQVVDGIPQVLRVLQRQFGAQQFEGF